MTGAPVRPPRTFPVAVVVACLALLSAIGFSVAGVFILVGAGWALLTAAGPCFLISAVILRGLARGK